MPTRNRQVRNLAAQSPLLRKGGLHEKSKTGQRTRERLSTHSAIDEWLEDLEEINHNNEQEEGAKAPFL